MPGVLSHWPPFQDQAHLRNVKIGREESAPGNGSNDPLITVAFAVLFQISTFLNSLNNCLVLFRVHDHLFGFSENKIFDKYS